MRAPRVLVAGIVAVCVLAVIATAFADRDATHSRAPSHDVPSSTGVVIAQPGPAPLIPPPQPDVAEATPSVRSDAGLTPPATVPLSTVPLSTMPLSTVPPGTIVLDTVGAQQAPPA